ncbi:oligosaccharide flippase family protein [Thalassotalea ponticola]|uniref:lipopolysaccharide biosynthesis protein n=1 Tax=Thalassotalea ponticola TaxID=1523392 RepID=UPI0025B5B992|nr:oligosaccharide flippase family protein [Thalassotalea ponticola]MDN3652415.1 oligosaccharide flippase family protein [Thalassotalea ponticola]
MQTAMAGVNLYSEYICGMLASIVIARSLTTTEYGLYSSIIFLASMFTLSINAGMNINVTKFVAELSHQAPHFLSSFTYLINRLFALRLLIATCLVVGVIAVNFDFGVPALVIAGVLVGATFKARYTLDNAVLKGLRRFDTVAKVSLIVNPTNVLAVVACAIWLPTLNYFLAVYAATCLLFWLVIKSVGNDLPKATHSIEFDQQYRQRFIEQMISATFVVIFAGFTFRQSQVLVLKGYDFVEAAGFFNIAFILANAALTLVPGIYSEILLPKMAIARHTKTAKTEVLQAQRYLTLLACLVVFPLIVYAEQLVALLYGSRYLAVVEPLRWMVLFKFLGLLKEGANLTLISHDKQQVLAKINLLIFALMCVLSVVFVSQYGLMAGVWVYGILSIIQLLAYQHWARPYGYVMLPWPALLRIIVPALIMFVPLLLLEMQFSRWWMMILGSLIFVAGYLHLLIWFGAFDQTGQRFIISLQRKAPFALRAYLGWLTKGLTAK